MEPTTDGAMGAQTVELDVAELGRLVRERRGATSLRAAAQEANVSFSTLSRVEAGAQPDLASFTSICAWLGVSPSRFFAPAASRPEEPLELAIHHLHQDSRLDGRSAAAIAHVMRELYASLAKEVTPSTLVACHLRASSVLRPGVAPRLAELLQDMHDALERELGGDD